MVDPKDFKAVLVPVDVLSSRVFERDLVYCDGPLTSVFRTNVEIYLMHWVDCDALANRWLIFRVRPKDYEEILSSGVIALRSLIETNPDGFVYIEDLGEDVAPIQTWQCPAGSLPEDYLPTPGRQSSIDSLEERL